MDEIPFILNRKIFFLLIFILSIDFSFSYLEFKFPYAFKLENKNIFVIHQLGVSICNKNYTEIISNQVTFSNSEKIATDEALSKIALVSAQGYYLICLISDKIYIFDGDGYFLKNSTSITSQTVECYSVEYLNLIGNYLYFVIGFISNQKLYLYSYTYYIPSKTFQSYNQYQFSNSLYNIINSGLSCHYMNSSNYNRFIIICLYGVKYNDVKDQVCLNWFDITDQGLTPLKREYLTIQSEFKYIKSTLLPDYKNLYVGLMSSNGIAYHWKYNINMDSTSYKFKYFNASNCKVIPHGFKYNYYPEKSELIYTCLLEKNSWTIPNAKILVENIYLNDSQKNYTYKYDNCHLHGYSIIYLDSENDYYIISDTECSNTLISFDILFENFKKETTVITEAVILEEKEKEEEKNYEEEENMESSIEEEKNYLTIIEYQKEKEININEEEEEKFLDAKKEEYYEENEIKKDYGKELEKEENKASEKEEEIKEEEDKIEKEKDNKGCEQLEKCEICNVESLNKNLCIKCNNVKGYYFLNKDSISEEEIGDRYIECVNKETKPSKFYFNKDNEDYRLCYETCATCDKGGDWEINNCKTCKNNYILKPDTNLTTNCVAKCPSYYYYAINGQYKCTENEYCPLNYILLIKEKGKCTNDCKNDDIYKYQYDNQCFKYCPNNTINDNFICIDKDKNIATLTETYHKYFDMNTTNKEIDQLAKNYIDNFYYTSNHVSIYKSDNFTLALYKNTETITNLSLPLPKINIDDCLSKIKSEYNIKEDLIIALESEKIDKQNDKIISVSVYNPLNRKKIIFNSLCLNDSVIVEEELRTKIKDLDSFLYLANQGIDLFNSNSEFFTDLCTHFKSPINGKDIPLRERFKLFFHNVSLCETGCSIKGINTTTNTSICECKLNDLINNEFLGENIFFQSTMAELKSFFQETNIEVLRCYKDLIKGEFYTSNYGSFVILGLLLIQIILTVIYYKKFIFSMRKYLFNLTQTYLSFLSKQGYSSSNKLDNSSEPIQNKLIKFKAISKKKSAKNLMTNDANKNNFGSNKLITNSNLKNQRRKQNENFKTSVRNTFIEKHKCSNDDLIVNKSLNGKIPFESSLNTKYGNFLIIGNILDMDMEEYVKTDPDDMDYDNAIGRDKRTFCAYFVDNIKTDLLILNIFCNFEHLNPWPIKFLLFILNIDLYFFVNGLFFTEDYLSEILYDKNVNFLDYSSRFMDRIYYITLIGVIIGYAVDCFFFEERTIKKLFKREKNNILILQYEMSQIIKNIKSRYNLIIIICFVAAIFIWYYVFCFNNIYPSMKKEWIITSVIMVFVMQFFYFLKLLIETIIRFIAIKCKSERLFKFSQFLS